MVKVKKPSFKWMSRGNLENRGNLKSISWEYELAIDCILILNSKALNLSCQR